MVENLLPNVKFAAGKTCLKCVSCKRLDSKFTYSQQPPKIFTTCSMLKERANSFIDDILVILHPLALEALDITLGHMVFLALTGREVKGPYLYCKTCCNALAPPPTSVSDSVFAP